MQNIGNLMIHKGKIGEISMKMWDAVPLCDSHCPLWESQCPYDKTQPRCQLRRVYIESVVNSLNKAVSAKDEMTMHRIGMLLVPLYTSLISIKLDIYARGGNMRGSKGGVDQIYRELRDTIRLIDSMLKDLDINKDVKGKSRGFLDGDADYYDDLLQDGHVPA